MISKKDVRKFNIKYKKLSENTIIKKPAIKEESGPSSGVYYGISESVPIVAKCYNHRAIKFGMNINDMFLILSGEKAKAIVNSKYHYYISPYCNAGTLKELIDKDVRFNEEEITSFILQISKQLAALHETRNLYHGELTPEHILIHIESDGSITYKICGFGHYVKKPKEYYNDESRVRYLDPRIIENPYANYDPSCDVWSLGIICTKLVTGKFPGLDDKSWVGSPYEHLKEMDDNPTQALLNHVISRCLFEDSRFRILAKNICFQPFFIPVRDNIGNYVFDKILGSGSFGDVYLTYLKNNSVQKYATKVLKSLMKADYRNLITILGELPVLLILRNSPYVVRIIDFFKYNDQVHLILEYFNGGDLNEFLRKIEQYMKEGNNVDKQRVNIEMIEDTWIVAFNLAHALYDMHEKCILHRDIKPANLLISIDERTKRIASAKLSDFGTSRELLSDSPAETFIGTIGFMAPEMSLGYYDLEIDVWSYGVVLYTIAYGINPREYTSQMYENGRVKHPPRTRYNLPESLVDLIERCLVFNAEHRLRMKDVINHPYFRESPCISLKEVPSYYKVSEDSPLFQTAQFLVKKILYLPTNTQLLLKLVKADEVDFKLLSKTLNELIVFRECPHIFKLHHCFKIDDNYCFVLDYTEGKTLEDYVKALGEKRLKKEEMRKFIFALAEAIADIHAYKLTHGRISASSLYICPDTEGSFTVRLAGYDQLIHDVTGIKLHSDGKSDIYKFGEVLYFMLFGNIKKYGDYHDLNEKNISDEKELLDIYRLAQKCTVGTYQTITEVQCDQYFNKKY